MLGLNPLERLVMEVKQVEMDENFVSQIVHLYIIRVMSGRIYVRVYQKIYMVGVRVAFFLC